MRIYKITKGQLITIWIFGLLGTLIAFINLSDYDPSPLSPILLLGLPAFLIFYTIGWRANKKKNINTGDQVHCTSCGKKIVSDGKFCVSCGKEVYAQSR